MSGYTPFEIVGMLWALIAAIYLTLFLILSVIGMKEEDNLYLSAGEARMAEEQKQVMKSIDRWTFITHKFGYAALAMTVVLAAMWCYNVAQELF